MSDWITHMHSAFSLVFSLFFYLSLTCSFSFLFERALLCLFAILFLFQILYVICIVFYLVEFSVEQIKCRPQTRTSRMSSIICNCRIKWCCIITCATKMTSIECAPERAARNFTVDFIFGLQFHSFQCIFLNYLSKLCGRSVNNTVWQLLFSERLWIYMGLTLVKVEFLIIFLGIFMESQSIVPNFGVSWKVSVYLFL